jgi:hypothetical protein
MDRPDSGLEIKVKQSSFNFYVAKSIEQVKQIKPCWVRLLPTQLLLGDLTLWKAEILPYLPIHS